MGPRLQKDRESFPPNNLLLMLAGAGMLWLGWSGFNGGDPYQANIDASLAVINTHICTATSLLVWITLDMLVFHKPSVIGAVQGMVTGLVCITPAAGIVEGWAAIVMGLASGSIPWFTMMVVHKRSRWLQKVDDTMAVFHTHAVAGALGGFLTGLFAEPHLCHIFSQVPSQHGLLYSWNGSYVRGLYQLVVQCIGAAFIIVWNIVATSAVCILIGLFVPLRLEDEKLEIGDDAVHGEAAYALFADGEPSQSSGKTENGEQPFRMQDLASSEPSRERLE